MFAYASWYLTGYNDKFPKEKLYDMANLIKLEYSKFVLNKNGQCLLLKRKENN